MTNKIAIAFNTKDRTNQVKKVLERLHDPSKVDLWWFDGSEQPAGQQLPYDYIYTYKAYSNVKGSGDNAVALALTEMLDHMPQYSYIGICEDDVLLEPDWFERCMDLFAPGLGVHDGLTVGAVSARAYDDRVFIQRDGYAVMHNLGWGHVIFTREAAFHTLKHYRTGWTTENRRVFSQLSGKDIASLWCWRGSQQWICSDWGNDAVLAQYGLASLALTPSACDMIGQNPPLEQQGLRLATREVSVRKDERTFNIFCERMDMVRSGKLSIDGRPVVFRKDDGGFIYFSHQLGMLEHELKGQWKMLHHLGFGPFAFQADSEDCQLDISLSGSAEIMLGGGDNGGKAMVLDLASGYECEPQFQNNKVGTNPLFMNVVVPATVAYRRVRVRNITPGVVLFGIHAREPQPVIPTFKFNASVLPPAAAMPSVETMTQQGPMPLAAE